MSDSKPTNGKNIWFPAAYMLEKPEDGLRSLALACWECDDGTIYYDVEGSYKWAHFAYSAAKDYAEALNGTNTKPEDVPTLKTETDLPAGRGATWQIRADEVAHREENENTSVADKLKKFGFDL